MSSGRADDHAIEDGAQNPARRAGGLRILVVDDDKDAAESLAALLAHDGHAMSIAHDGESAIEMAERIEPDVIFLDIGLPKLNGYEAAKRLRSGALRGVTLIAVTGWGEIADRGRSSEAGFDHHLTKPIEPRDLSRILEARLLRA